MKRFLTATPEVAAKKARTDSQWDWTSSDESLLVGKFKVPAAYTKIAAFDFDGTLSVTVSGKSFPVGPEDARLLYPSKTRAAFRRLHDEGYCIVIFSNQNGVGSGKTTAADVKSRMSLVLGSVDVPCFCYCALLKDRFRKPAPGMWLRFLQDNALVEVELHPDSFFCGDAAGRTKPKKDFSDSDLKFSHNCGMAFYTPEEYFDGVPRQPHPVTGFDPKSLLQPVFSRPYEEQLGSLLKDIREHPNGKWMVLLVGYPAMGKTTLCKTMFPSFAYVNRDTTKSTDKAVALCSDFLKEGRSCIVDATHPSIELRKRYCALGRQYNAKCVCLYMCGPGLGDAAGQLALAKHLNAFRLYIGINLREGEVLDDRAFAMFKSQFQEPSVADGFESVLPITFCTNMALFGHDEEAKRFFTSYLV